MRDRVVDEHGRLTAETITEAERIFLERPDLLAQFARETSTILRDAARRPSPARSARELLEESYRAEARALAAIAAARRTLKCENLPEEAPALTSPGERRR